MKVTLKELLRKHSHSENPEILLVEPGLLTDVDDPNELTELATSTKPWTEEHTKLFDYVYSELVVRVLASGRGVEELSALYVSIRTVAAYLRAQGYEDTASRWRGYASIIDSRIEGLKTMSGATAKDSVPMVQEIVRMLRDRKQSGIARSVIARILRKEEVDLVSTIRLMECNLLIRCVWQDDELMVYPVST